MIVYHSTSLAAANAILADGFRDTAGSYMFVGLTEPLRGVFVGKRPPNEQDGASVGVVFAIEVPDDELEPYWITEEAAEMPGGVVCWEAVVPAELLNRHGPPTVIEE